jgi:Amidohydrolase
VHSQLGIDNILFSVDDPFSDNFEAIDFLNATQLSKEDREKLAHGNAERLLKLSTDAQSEIVSKESVVPNLKSSMFAFKAKVKSNVARRVLSFLVK